MGLPPMYFETLGSSFSNTGFQDSCAAAYRGLCVRVTAMSRISRTAGKADGKNLESLTGTCIAKQVFVDRVPANASKLPSLSYILSVRT